jgi:hypothetical protein
MDIPSDPGGDIKRKKTMTNRSLPAIARAFDLIVVVAFVTLSLALTGATAALGA